MATPGGRGMMLKKRDFGNAHSRPTNYVAGIGRGATGFTTRSDIGPARSSADAPEKGGGVPAPTQAPVGYKAGAGRGVNINSAFGDGGLGPGEAAPRPTRHDDSDEDEDLNDTNYDEFSGYGGGLFADSVYDKDDVEADKVYEEVDAKMDTRRQVRREARLKEELEKYRAERPKIQQQFADLKKGLNHVSAEEWDSIPDVGDYRIKRRKREIYTPVPDSLLEKARKESQGSNFQQLDTRQQKYGGLQTPAPGMATPHQDLTQVGEARGQVLGVKLDQMSDSVTGQTVVDPKGYLTDLKSKKINTDAEIGDIKKARVLMRSVITTNPGHAPGWIAAARLEEVAGKIAAARNLMNDACAACPNSEDVWLEAARLQTPENAKAVLAKGVKHIPSSVKLWMQASNLEKETGNKKKVLRKALEVIPNSIKLWKAAVELEDDPDDARVILSAAVTCVPHSVDMWLALARLEDYEQARKVLNKARLAISTEPLIWITAAQLEEANGNTATVPKIIQRAIESMELHQVQVERETWLKEAKACEQNRSVATCQAIVRAVISKGVPEEDRKTVWIEDAEAAIQEGYYETARAVYGFALQTFPTKKSLWLRAAHVEREHGSRESLDTLLSQAVKKCPHAEVLWLMGAKEKWMAGDVDAARTILGEAFDANSQSEPIWLAAVKLEFENNEIQRAKVLLDRAREQAGTQKVWLKSAQLERQLGNAEEERRMLEEAIRHYPNYDKLWMMLGQLEHRVGNFEKARDVYVRGIKANGKSVPLWLLMVRLESEQKLFSKARAILEKARLKNPKEEQLWLESVRLEVAADNHKNAETLLAKALQECPTSGVLWAEGIAMAPRPQKRSKTTDAMKKCDNDPVIIVTVARLFWTERKNDRARQWFDRALALNPDFGDGWAYYYRMELQHGTEDQQEAVLNRCRQAAPRHGERWIAVSKAIENYRLQTEDVLRRVAAQVPLVL
eukprot:GFYU01005929.1.p1 GENE.GFYU01005929.1~~GFYU01005929.1.p1  ORF type:complete len:962 (-),score=313.69 GFYU01005929.1:140-3025(-)